jgi:hypothetical protein
MVAMPTRYGGLRSELARVREEFVRASERAHGLHLDLIFTPQFLPAPAEEWERFIRSESSSGWSSWQVFPDRRIAARFHGDRTALDLYLRLAKTGLCLLQEFRRLEDLGEGTPPGFRVRLSGSYEGHFAWLMLIHRTAWMLRSAFLSFRVGIHGEPGASEEDFIRAEAQNDHLWGECGARLLRRLTSHRLEYDVFRSSAEAIRLWLRPEEWVSHGFDSIDPATGVPYPAVYDPERMDIVIVLPEELGQIKEPHENRAVETPAAQTKPRWDGRRLFLGGGLVKEYGVPAWTQCKILQAFEEAGWVDSIPDPLAGRNDLPNSKRLGDAITGLNKSIGKRGITFHRDGTGKSVCWKFADKDDG